MRVKLRALIFQIYRLKNLFNQVSSVGKYTPKLFFDGANGVGAEKMATLSKNLDELLQVYNNNNLNHIG